MLSCRVDHRRCVICWEICSLDFRFLPLQSQSLCFWKHVLLFRISPSIFASCPWGTSPRICDRDTPCTSSSPSRLCLVRHSQQSTSFQQISLWYTRGVSFSPRSFAPDWRCSTLALSAPARSAPPTCCKLSLSYPLLPGCSYSPWWWSPWFWIGAAVPSRGWSSSIHRTVYRSSCATTCEASPSLSYRSPPPGFLCSAGPPTGSLLSSPLPSSHRRTGLAQSWTSTSRFQVIRSRAPPHLLPSLCGHISFGCPTWYCEQQFPWSHRRLRAPSWAYACLC